MCAATLAGEAKLAIRDVLEQARGGLELVEVVVHEGAVALALAQRALHVGGIPLVLHVEELLESLPGKCRPGNCIGDGGEHPVEFAQ